MARGFMFGCFVSVCGAFLVVLTGGTGEVRAGEVVPHRTISDMAAFDELGLSISVQAASVANETDREQATVSVVDATTGALLAIRSDGSSPYVQRRRQAIAPNPSMGINAIPGAHRTGSITTIDFDRFSDDTIVPEGVVITDEYADMGAIFSIADTLFPPDVLVTDDASDGIDIFAGMSVPNVLGFHGYAPGPGWWLGCNADLRVDFVDTDTQEPTTVTSANIRIFARAASGDRVLQLVARDLSGDVVGADEVTVPFWPPISVVLSVSTGQANIASIETEGSTGQDMCMAFDNLVFEAGPTEAVPVDSYPPDGSIDARRPSNPACTELFGWDSIDIVYDGDTTGVQASDFTVTVDPADYIPPAIVNVVPNDNTATLEFDTRIPLGHWTIITHDISGFTTRFGALPADVNGGRTSTPLDILSLIDFLNGVGPALDIWQTDIDRSGAAGALDILAVINLLNGAGCLDVWNGASLPE